MLRGHRTSEPRPKATPKKVYGECEHARVDYRGSTRSVHKVYCLDCCTYIEEVPQRLHKAGKELAGKVQDLPLGQQDLTRRQLDEVEFTSMEAGSIIKQGLGNLGEEVKTRSGALRKQDPPIKINPKNPRPRRSGPRASQETVLIVHRR